MKITLETLYQAQQRLEREIVATRNDMIKWVVGLFIGTIIVITSSVGLYSAFLMAQG